MTQEKYNRIIQAAVPSKDVREYCEKIGRTFAPYELATLICQNTLLGYSQKDALLAELVPELRAEPDSKAKTINGVYKNHYSNSEVADEIEAYIDMEKKMKDYLLNDFPGYVYELEYEETGSYRDFYNCGVFSSINKVYETMEKEIQDFKELNAEILSFRLRKYKLDDRENYVNGKFVPEKDNPDKFGLNYLDSSFMGHEYCFNHRDGFDNLLVLIPHPFRNGDIIRRIDDGLMGVVCNIQNDEVFFESLQVREKRGGDITDIGIPADYLEDETFTYEHLAFFPTLCEKVDIASCKDSDPKIPLLEACATVMKGNGSFEYLFHEWNKYIDERRMEYHRHHY